MSTQTIDYNALARQAGALSSFDYDSLAKQAGATSSVAPAPPGVAKPTVDMQKEPLSPLQQRGAQLAENAVDVAHHIAPLAKQAANDTYDVSAPGIATEVAKHIAGQPNNLKKLPAKMVMAWLAAGGLPEADVVEAAPVKAATPEASVPKVVPQVAQPAPLAAPAAEVPAATPTAAAPSVAAPVVQAKKFATLSDLQGQINDALGGKALQPDAPIFQRKTLTDLQGQIKKAVGPAAKPTPKGTLSDLQGQISDAAKPPLPQDFTPLPDSSLLKGYKYDPEKQQFSAILNNGESYTHGEVTPEQVKAFEDADSQGSAWTKKIKQGPGTVLVEKNGLPVKKAKALASSDGDLTSILTQSVANALKGTK